MSSDAVTETSSLPAAIATRDGLRRALRHRSSRASHCARSIRTPATAGASATRTTRCSRRRRCVRGLVADHFPADTVFVRAMRGEFDAVIAPYHDVGMTAIKVASFGSGVNVTLGPAVSAHVSGSWHRHRYRGQRHRRSRQLPRSGATRGTTRAPSERLVNQGTASASKNAALHAHGEDCIHTAALDAMREGNPEVRRRLAWALAITLLFMFAEVAGGLIANSLALLADAGHMLTDAGALALALGVAWWNARVFASVPAADGSAGASATLSANNETARRLQTATERREAWAALINGSVLLLVCTAIIVEAVARLRVPEPVETGLMLVVATLGLFVNIAAALMLRPVVAQNLNARGAYVHVLGDLLGSVGTIAAAIIIQQSGYLIADPVASLLVSALVLRAAGLLVRDASRVLRKERDLSAE